MGRRADADQLRRGQVAPALIGPLMHVQLGYAPQLVVEIAASPASYDLHQKYWAYERAGVPEYVAWRVLDGALDWFRIEHGRYVRIELDAAGIIESAEFPGLRLAVASLPAGDPSAVRAALQPGT